MRSITPISRLLILVSLLFSAHVLSAAYTETINLDQKAINMKRHGLVDDGGATNQSEALQAAIDDMAQQGGGRIIIPRGTYTFSEVALKSNVHLQIKKGTVIKVAKGKWGGAKWAFEIGREQAVENTSIRGLDGRFTVDLREYTYEDRVRAIALADVDNFLITDMDVQDNSTIFSAIILGSPDSERTGFSGPRNGTIQNCSTFNASIGYGLVQSHAAKSVHYENLYSLGGVAMRLECGVRPKNPEQIGGLFDITGKNIRCENGYVALLLSPHSTQCGVVNVEDVEAISCEFGVKLTNGFISNKKQREGDAPGVFAKGSSIKNIHVVYGTEAQRSPLHLKYTPVELRDQVVQSGPGALKGPSVAGVLYQANYEMLVEDLSVEGFEYVEPILTKEDGFKDAALKAWAKPLTKIVKGAPSTKETE